MQIAGVDDAGRGPVIGPLTIAGVLLDKNDLPKLVDLGIKDSKRLSSDKREVLAAEIKDLAIKHYTEKLSPSEIDRVVETGKKLHKLNRLEARTMAKVIAYLKPDIAYVDASDVLADRYKDHIKETLSFQVRIISEHKADVNYPIVSAASIIAKVERDKVISELQGNYGNIGCGYPTDPNTIKFLKEWIRKFGDYPDFVRKSWKTAKRLKNEVKTTQSELV